MKPYSVDWWWVQYEMATINSVTLGSRLECVRYGILTDWIRKRIEAKIIQYERERQFPEEDPDL
jgi:hypothetical protein